MTEILNSSDHGERQSITNIADKLRASAVSDGEFNRIEGHLSSTASLVSKGVLPSLKLTDESDKSSSGGCRFDDKSHPPAESHPSDHTKLHPKAPEHPRVSHGCQPEHKEPHAKHHSHPLRPHPVEHPKRHPGEHSEPREKSPNHHFAPVKPCPPEPERPGEKTPYVEPPIKPGDGGSQPGTGGRSGEKTPYAKPPMKPGDSGKEPGYSGPPFHGIAKGLPPSVPLHEL